MGQTGQTGSYAKHEPDSLIKRVNCVNLNMIRTRLASTHDLFINGLVVLSSWVVSDFTTPN